jgi:L-amino acid N-acyltransferase YncA
LSDHKSHSSTPPQTKNTHPTTGTTIRFATQRDLPQIMAILNREIADGINCFRTRLMSNEDSLKWWQAREEGKYPVWVGEREGRVVGWASLSKWSAYEAYDRTCEVSVWIVPEAQRQGLGRQFFTTLIQYATTTSFRVILSRIESNNVASLALHHAFGFSLVGTMHNVGEKQGKLLHVVMMELQLPHANQLLH